MNVWIIVAADPAVHGLADAGRSIASASGGEVVAAVAGPRGVAEQVARCGVDRVLWFGEPGESPVEAYAPVVAAQVTRIGAALVLAAGRSGDRVLLAAVAAALGCPVLTGVNAVRAGNGAGPVVERSVYGGIAEQTERLTGPVALVMAGGGLGRGESAPVEEVAVEAGQLGGLTVTRTTGRDAASVDLTAAPRVLAIGRGVRRREDLPMIEALAAAARAGVGCSRPLAEGLGWYPRDRYIGVSGQKVAPQLYLAVGISGEVQHMSGCRGARVLVAVNKDPNALIFAEADYGIVGDLYDVVPALTAALEQGSAA